MSNYVSRNPHELHNVTALPVLSFETLSELTMFVKVLT